MAEVLRQHDACPGYGPVRDNDLAERDADSQLGPQLTRRIVRPKRLFGLKCYRRGYGVGRALELGQQGIAAQFPDAAVIVANGYAETVEGILDPGVSQLLILLHQPGRADNVRVQDDGELAR